ncbi:MAG TPA: hypothetical protein VKE69_01670, partial [Planctomycetota bacterium]|nr:hypothetical protein [Planctomycetota bacterium]
IRLEPPAEIVGRVVDRDGSPIECDVDLVPADYPRCRGEICFQEKRRSDAEGRFRFENLGRSTYAIRTVDEALPRAIAVVDLRGTARAEALLRCDAGTHVAVRSRRPVSMFAIVRDDRGRPIWMFTPSTSSVAGAVLPRGAYRIQAFDTESRISVERSFEVGSESLSIELAPK